MLSLKPRTRALNLPWRLGPGRARTQTTLTPRSLDLVLDVADSEARQGRPLTGPLSVRTVAPSRHYLSPMYGRQTCTIEIVMLRNGATSLRSLAPYVEALVSLGGRPHLGLHLPDVGFAYGRCFPKLGQWHQAMRLLDPRGTFRCGAVARQHLFGA